jgi:hypothetical protein
MAKAIHPLARCASGSCAFSADFEQNVGIVVAACTHAPTIILSSGSVPYITLATLQVQLEGSGKWPNDNEAMAKMKAALGCEIANALESQLSMHARATEHCLDVYFSGFAFRLVLWSDRDEAIADRTLQVAPSASSLEHASTCM